MAEYKRPIAYKLKIGDLIRGSPIIENEKLIFIELGDKKTADNALKWQFNVSLDVYNTLKVRT